jgi:membrane fusion protein
MRSTLFRQEALEAHHSKQLGEVFLARPLALSLLTTLGVLIALGVVLFASFAEYTRKAHVTGYLAPTKGLVKVHAPQSGTLIEMRVEEGQQVKQGDVLYVLSTERSSLNARESQALAIAQLRERRASLVREISQRTTLANAANTELRERVRGIAAELTQIQAEMATQTERVASAQQTFDRYDEVARRKFISQVQLSQQRDQLLDQQSRLQAMERTRSTRERDLRSLEAELATHRLRAASDIAAIERGVLGLDQELTESESKRVVVVTAPTAGLVTANLVQRGQIVSPSAPLLTILPEGAALEAHLFLPSRTAGFVNVSQSVALRYQAFPYQHFGSQHGVVKEISRTLIAPAEQAIPVTLNEPAYRVIVALDNQSIRAYGKAVPLQAGMVLDADIALDRRRLMQWVFDPLYAVSGRI